MKNEHGLCSASPDMHMRWSMVVRVDKDAHTIEPENSRHSAPQQIPNRFGIAQCRLLVGAARM
jgi:hypothetical protein